MKDTFQDNALIINLKHVPPFQVLAHALRRDQEAVVVIEDNPTSTILGISSSDGIEKTIFMLEHALADLKDRLK